MDRRIINQHDSIKQRMLVLETYKDEEILFRDINSRLLAVAQHTKETDLKMLAFNHIIDITGTQNYIIRQINLSKKEVSIEGNVDTIHSLADLINNLREQPYVTAINLSQLQNVDNQLSFTLNATTK